MPGCIVILHSYLQSLYLRAGGREGVRQSQDKHLLHLLVTKFLLYAWAPL